jgi:LPS sulfotransferase NodH
MMDPMSPPHERPKVLLVTGFGRSGTTLVNTILGSTPGVFAAGEVRFVWERALLEQRRCGCGELVVECPVWRPILERAFGGPDGVDAAALVAEDARVTRTRHLPLLLFGGRFGDPLLERLHALPGKLEQLYRAIAAETGARLIVDTSKPPSFGYVLDDLPGIDLRIVHVVRDPRAVANSWTRTKALTDGAQRDVMEQLSPVQSAVQWDLWNAAASTLWGDRPTYLRVRYEDLTADPTTEIRKILEHVGEPQLDPPLRDHYAVATVVHSVAGNADRMRSGPLRIRADDGWVAELPTAQRRVVTAITAPVSAAYGYPLRRRTTTTAAARPPRRTTDPVFLLGAPRSGTSLLYKCLALNPGAAWVSNWVERFPRLEVLAALNRLTYKVPALQQRVWFGGEGGNAYVYNQGRPLRHKLVPMPTEGESLFARCGLPEAPVPDDVPKDVSAAALRRSFDRVRRFAGGRRLVNKRIANNLRIPLLAEAFPDARFVLLTRDGRAVASSLRQVNWWPGFWVFWYGSSTDRWEADGGDPWELAARHWVEEVNAIEAGLAGVPTDQVQSISYEDFVADPLGCLDDIAEFCDLPADAEWRQRLTSLSFPDNNEAWRRRMDPDVLAVIEAAQKDTLRRYGYV